MGGSESSHGGRRVTFGLDERDQVRVLQGIRLTEDVVNRMKESSQSKRDNQRSPRASNGTAPSSLTAEGKPKSTGIHPPMSSDSAAEQELYRRYEQEHALVQEELLRLAKREREAASEARERNSINEEKQRTAQMNPLSAYSGFSTLTVVGGRLTPGAAELQGREAELKRQEAFYKEQLARIERKNAEIYKLTSEQYQEAAAKAEEWIK
ncbi:MICOS complex subunit mic25 [Pitangus sulphuratus]|nr:MICOS complex subunit mic25 [Pitangus sulphuratus]